MGCKIPATEHVTPVSAQQDRELQVAVAMTWHWAVCSGSSAEGGQVGGVHVDVAILAFITGNVSFPSAECSKCHFTRIKILSYNL